MYTRKGFIFDFKIKNKIFCEEKDENSISYKDAFGINKEFYEKYIKKPFFKKFCFATINEEKKYSLEYFFNLLENGFDLNEESSSGLSVYNNSENENKTQIIKNNQIFFYYYH